MAEGESSLKQGKGRVIDGELSDSEKKAKKKDDKRKEATRKVIFSLKFTHEKGRNLPIPTEQWQCFWCLFFKI